MILFWLPPVPDFIICTKNVMTTPDNWLKIHDPCYNIVMTPYLIRPTLYLDKYWSFPKGIFPNREKHNVRKYGRTLKMGSSMINDK